MRLLTPGRAVSRMNKTAAHDRWQPLGAETRPKKNRAPTIALRFCGTGDLGAKRLDPWAQIQENEKAAASSFVVERKEWRMEGQLHGCNLAAEGCMTPACACHRSGGRVRRRCGRAACRARKNTHAPSIESALHHSPPRALLTMTIDAI